MSNEKLTIDPMLLADATFPNCGAYGFTDFYEPSVEDETKGIIRDIRAVDENIPGQPQLFARISLLANLPYLKQLFTFLEIEDPDPLITSQCWIFHSPTDEHCRPSFDWAILQLPVAADAPSSFLGIMLEHRITGTSHTIYLVHDRDLDSRSASPGRDVLRFMIDDRWHDEPRQRPAHNSITLNQPAQSSLLRLIHYEQLDIHGDLNRRFAQFIIGCVQAVLNQPE